MSSTSGESAARSLDRINLRLDPETFEAIDALHAERPGNISRNTWITEAIQEKLVRETARDDSQSRRRK
jgi:predicted HicB family RNase H-like nuclease